MASQVGLLQKCERLQIARSEKGVAWKAVAKNYLPMALLAQRHRDWVCLLVLPPQTSILALKVRAEGLLQPFCKNANEKTAVRAEDLRQPCSQSANVCRELAARKS